MVNNSGGFPVAGNQVTNQSNNSCLLTWCQEKTVTEVSCMKENKNKNKPKWILEGSIIEMVGVG